jgi:hypothetical protein
MQTFDKYANHTESAVRNIFNSIESYVSILKPSSGITFISSELDLVKQQSEYEAWLLKNKAKINKAKAAQKKFVEESFALDVMCGALLQVADKAIEVYSINTEIPKNLKEIINPSLSKYCIGRLVRGVPLGLIIYAGRNQHIHYSDSSLREPSKSVFKLLANGHGIKGFESHEDPAFDLQNPALSSFAGNITGLIEWRSYNEYIADMKHMLNF